MSPLTAVIDIEVSLPNLANLAERLDKLFISDLPSDLTNPVEWPVGLSRRSLYAYSHMSLHPHILTRTTQILRARTNTQTPVNDFLKNH